MLIVIILKQNVVGFMKTSKVFKRLAFENSLYKVFVFVPNFGYRSTNRLLSFGELCYFRHKFPERSIISCPFNGCHVDTLPF